MSNINWIGIKENGHLKYRYHHWGGDVDQNGELLLNHYKDTDTIRALLAEGDASELDETIENSVFYSRDRGEEMAPYVTDTNSNFRPNRADDGELCFLWDRGKWWVSYNQKGKWYELSYAVVNHLHTVESREGM